MARPSAAARPGQSRSSSSSPASSTDSCILVETGSKTSTSTRPTSVSSNASHEAIPVSKKRPASWPSQSSRLESFGFTSSAARPTKTTSLPNIPTPKPQNLRVSSALASSGTWLEDLSEDDASRHVSSSSQVPLLGNSRHQTRPVSGKATPGMNDTSKAGRSRVLQAPKRSDPSTSFTVSEVSESRQFSGETLVEKESIIQEDPDRMEKAASDAPHLRGTEEPVEATPAVEEAVKGLRQVQGKSKPTGVRKMIGAVAATATSLGKRGRDAYEKGKDKLHTRKSGRLLDFESREDTAEEEPAAKKLKRSVVSAPSLLGGSSNVRDPSPKPLGSGRKTWRKSGLYVGQHRGFNTKMTGQQNKAKRSSEAYWENRSCPLPMYFGEDMLRIGRDFKLPFDIYNPLPNGQPKPDEWRKTQSNRVVGNANAAVKEWSKVSKLPSSKCMCLDSTGCDDNCINRTMLYECQSSNCNLGSQNCGNRPFADLKERCKTGRKYDIGVEVMATHGKGFGIRANRTFEPNQVIVEYAGEIIDQEECNRRTLEEYKDARCYYLMEFDKDLIIDATRGTIARFVNHSCEPNCEMIKWSVNGKPRMALFAGDNGIMTGEELTYDYNFDNFNENNTTPCACGAPNCRGVLGRKPTEQEAKKQKKTLMAAAAAAAKAALEAALRGGKGKDGDGKKRKKHKGWVYLDANGKEVEEDAALALAEAAKGGKAGRKRKADEDDDDGAGDEDAGSKGKGPKRVRSVLKKRRPGSA